MKISALTVTDVSDFWRMAYSLFQQLAEDEKKDTSGKDWGTGAMHERFEHFKNRLNDNVKLNNCEPLSGRVEVPELSPDGLIIFSEFCAWVHTTPLHDKLKNVLH